MEILLSHYSDSRITFLCEVLLDATYYTYASWLNHDLEIIGYIIVTATKNKCKSKHDIAVQCDDLFVHVPHVIVLEILL